jgi:hypothetical protein
MITNYRDLSIGKYLDIQAAIKEEAEEIDQMVKVLSILTGKTVDNLMMIPIVEFTELSRKLSFLYESVEPSKRLEKYYKVGDFELVPTIEVPKMVTAQYVDFQSFSKFGDTKIVELMSTILIPKGKKYNDGYDILDVQKAIRENLSVTDVITLSAFFLRQWHRSIRAMLTCSRWLVMMTTKKKSMERKEKIREIDKMIAMLPNGVGWNV